jgi:hypothetical protein
MDNKQFVAGQILLLSGGEYSSYGVSAVARVIRDFTSADVAALAKAKAVTVRQSVGLGIVDLLVGEGWIEEVDSRELHEDDRGIDSHSWRWASEDAH